MRDRVLKEQWGQWIVVSFIVLLWLIVFAALGWLR